MQVLTYEEFRRQGIQKAVYAQKTRDCIKLGVEELHMIVWISETTLPARAWYHGGLGMEPLPESRYCPYPVGHRPPPDSH